MEERLLLAIHAHAGPALDALFRVSHLLGVMPVGAALVVGMAAWHLGRGERGPALVWIGVGLTTLVLLQGLKPLVARPRPDLWPRLTTWPPIAGYGDFSFPSGHAMASAAFYPLLAAEIARSRQARGRLWCAGAASLAFFVGFGRLYLGVHWPTDVLAGWVLGAGQSLFAIRRLRSYSRLIA